MKVIINFNDDLCFENFLVYYDEKDVTKEKTNVAAFFDLLSRLGFLGQWVSYKKQNKQVVLILDNGLNGFPGPSDYGEWDEKIFNTEDGFMSTQEFLSQLKECDRILEEFTKFDFSIRENGLYFDYEMDKYNLYLNPKNALLLLAILKVLWRNTEDHQEKEKVRGLWKRISSGINKTNHLTISREDSILLLGYLEIVAVNDEESSQEKEQVQDLKQSIERGIARDIA